LPHGQIRPSVPRAALSRSASEYDRHHPEKGFKLFGEQTSPHRQRTAAPPQRPNFKTNRASVRRWAIQNHLAPDTRYKPISKPVKRWQAREEGALWQYDVSPHSWLPDNPSKQSLFDILDDATRLNSLGVTDAGLIYETGPDFRDNRTWITIARFSRPLLGELARRFPPDALIVVVDPTRYPLQATTTP